MEMLKLMPSLKDYLWGGRRLIDEYNFESDLDVIAESWILSTHKDGRNKIYGKNIYLDEYLNDNPNFLGKDINDLPILIKLIDAAKPLSIQVHPNEEYANKYENDHGKTEMWYVMDCDDDSFIYYGLNRDMNKEEFRKSIENNTILDYLNKINVKKGDYFLIEAGTLHAIGKGILICEVQQNSNVTYRVYDYMRKDKNGNYRELHIDKAIDVTNMKKTKLPSEYNVNDNSKLLVDCLLFKTNYYKCNDNMSIDTNNNSFTSIVILDGDGIISFKDKSFNYKKGDSFLIPSICDKIRFIGTCEMMLTTI